MAATRRFYGYFEIDDERVINCIHMIPGSPACITHLFRYLRLAQMRNRVFTTGKLLISPIHLGFACFRNSPC